MYKQLESGLLAPGLVLFGDNAYLNFAFMATPYPNVAGIEKENAKDNYNFYHSQVSCFIHCFSIRFFTITQASCSSSHYLAANQDRVCIWNDGSMMGDTLNGNAKMLEHSKNNSSFYRSC